VKLRSRVAAFAAAAGLAAGLVIVGGGGTAHAQDQVLIDCDRVAGTAKAKPVITNASTGVSASFKNSLTVGFPRTCTGDLAATAGPLTAFKGKVVGDITCAGAGGGGIPANGKVTNVYTEVVNLKVLNSSLYVRLGAGATLDTFGISTGIVTKGVGIGADVVGGLLQNPVVVKNPPGPNSTLDSSGILTPGLGSLTQGVLCQTGGNVVTTGILLAALAGIPQAEADALAVAYTGKQDITDLIFSTDGTSLLGDPVDSSIKLVYPDETP
jgi:hypothetical protein